MSARKNRHFVEVREITPIPKEQIKMQLKAQSAQRSQQLENLEKNGAGSSVEFIGLT